MTVTEDMRQQLIGADVRRIRAKVMRMTEKGFQTLSGNLSRFYAVGIPTKAQREKLLRWKRRALLRSIGLKSMAAGDVPHTKES